MMVGNMPSTLGGISSPSLKSEEKPNESNWYQDMLERVQKEYAQLESNPSYKSVA